MRPPIRIVLTGILVFLSAGVSAHAQSISSQPRQTEMATPPAVALPTARAREAVRALKHKKLYDSLAAAYQAARYRVEPNEHPAVPDNRPGTQTIQPRRWAQILPPMPSISQPVSLTALLPLLF